MPNQATFTITMPQGTHKVVLQQSDDLLTSISSFLDGDSHPLTGCRASKDGTSFRGNTVVRLWPFWFNDVVTVVVDPAADAATMSISGVNLTFAGTLSAGEAAALVAFVLACKLPSLADA